MSSKKKKIGHVAAELLVFLASLPLVWSGWSHFVNPYAFYQSILRYQLFGAKLAAFISFFLPSILLCSAGTMVLGFCKRGGTLIAAVMYLMFALIQASAVFRGLNISCGCFGPESHQVSLYSAALWICVSAGLIAHLIVFRHEVGSETGS